MAIKTSTTTQTDKDLYITVGNLNKVVEREVIIFDLDGVLIDNSERYRLSLAEVDPDVKSHDELPRNKRNQFWRIFLSEKYMDLDKPIPRVIEVLKKRRERFPIVIITGRTSNMLRKTLEQLKTFGIEYDALIMRQEGIYLKDHDFKEQVIKSLNLHVVEVHDDSVDVIETLHEYAIRGSFYWYKAGKYIYVPPVKIVVNGMSYMIEDSEDALRSVLEDIDVFQGSTVEIRYGDYKVSMPKEHAKAFIESLFNALSKELCYPECYYIEEAIPFFESLRLATEDAESGRIRKVRIFGEEHPSYVDIDFDNIFSDPKRVAESWMYLKKVGILSNYLL